MIARSEESGSTVCLVNTVRPVTLATKEGG
jgi:hypothetical protein